jgi:hypothetical protein
MIKFIKKAGVVAATAAVLGTSAHAAVFNASASFRTIADISFVENTALNFGTGVAGKAGTNCIITATAPDGATVTAVTALAAASTGCTNVGVAAGEYEIVGAASTVVTILLATAVDNDFSFAPAGEFNPLQSTGGGTTAFFPDSPVNVTLGASGPAVLAIGGELSIINRLNASTSFAVPYDISVVY